MGKYDNIRPDELEADLVRFARLILRLEERSLLLRSAPELQRLIGELRQKLFAYEVRATRDLGRPERESSREEPVDEKTMAPELKESLRVVREALERQKELYEEWDDEEGFSWEENDHD